MASEKLEQLKDEITLKKLQDQIQQEMIKALENSHLAEIFQNYGLIGDEVMQVRCSLNLTKIQFSDAVGNQAVKNFLQTIPIKTFGTTCGTCGSSICCVSIDPEKSYSSPKSFARFSFISLGVLGVLAVFFFSRLT